MSPDHQEQILIHLDTCSFCQQIVDSLSVSDRTLPAEAPLVMKDEPACLEVIERLLQQPKIACSRPDSSAETCAPDDVSLDFLNPSQQPGYIGRLDHYEIIELIGRGGMGIVLRAFDEKLRRVVAIKVIAPQIATSPRARKRFVREAQAAAAIRNEHVIDIHAVEDSGRLPFLVMDYIDGISLEERIKRSGPMKLHEVLRIGMQAAAGLAAAHAQGLVHRDIKPANILLENGVERVKITDFGLARAVDDARLTQSGVLTGTPQYMSPEQARGDPVDHRSDLFSLGSVLYAMCTGRPPFRGDSTVGVLKRVTDDTPRPLREVNAEISDDLAALVAKLLVKDPGARFQTASEVSALLGQQLAQLQQPLQSPPAPGPERPPKQRSSRLFAAVVLLIALALAGYQFGPALYRFVEDQGNVRADPAAVAPVGPIPAARPFVILSGDKVGQEFIALPDAVAAAQSGDTIEIRGNGPFVLQPLVLGDKALTLRAGEGHRPVFKNSDLPVASLSQRGIPHWTPLINTRASLVLEGLEIHRDDSDREQAFPGEPVILTNRGPVYLANCRFVLRPKLATNVLMALNSKSLEMRQCQVVSAGPAALTSWICPDVGKAVASNNLLVAQSGPFVGTAAIVLHYRQLEPRDVTIRLAENTLIGTHLHLDLDALPTGGTESRPPLRLESSGNIIDTDNSILDFCQNQAMYAPESRALERSEARQVLRRLFQWQEQANVYPEALTCLRHGINYAGFEAEADDPRSLAEWQAFWDMGASGSVQGPIRLAGGDLRARAASGLAALTPGDFRLAPASAGKGAGPGGKDLGADVDLVGPGPAYERWRKTPEYQQWRDATGQGSLHNRD